MSIPNNLPPIMQTGASTTSSNTIPPHEQALMKLTIILDKVALVIAEPKQVPNPITKDNFSDPKIMTIVTEWRNDLYATKKELQDICDRFGPQFLQTFSQEIGNLSSNLDDLMQEKDFDNFKSKLNFAYDSLDKAFNHILNQNRSSSNEYIKKLHLGDIWERWKSQFAGKMADPRFPPPRSDDSSKISVPAPEPVKPTPSEEPTLSQPPTDFVTADNTVEPITDNSKEIITNNYVSILECFHKIERAMGGPFEVFHTSRSEDTKVALMQQFRKLLPDLINNVKKIDPNSPVIVEANNVLQSLTPKLMQSYFSGDPDYAILAKERDKLTDAMEMLKASVINSFSITVPARVITDEDLSDIKDNHLEILKCYHDFERSVGGKFGTVYLPPESGEKQEYLRKKLLSLANDLIKNVKEIGESEDSPVIAQANQLIQNLNGIFFFQDSDTALSVVDHAKLNASIKELNASLNSTFSLGTSEKYITETDIINDHISILNSSNKIRNMVSTGELDQLPKAINEMRGQLDNFKKDVAMLNVDYSTLINSIDNLNTVLSSEKFNIDDFLKAFGALDGSVIQDFPIYNADQARLYLGSELAGPLDEMRKNYLNVLNDAETIESGKVEYIDIEAPEWQKNKNKLLESIETLKKLLDNIMPFLPDTIRIDLIQNVNVTQFENVVTIRAPDQHINITKGAADMKMVSMDYVSKTELSDAYNVLEEELKPLVNSNRVFLG